MKKREKSSARKVGKDSGRIYVEIGEHRHADFIRFAHAHGLTPQQGFLFLVNWALSTGTLTPDMDGDAWKQGEPL